MTTLAMIIWTVCFLGAISFFAFQIWGRFRVLLLVRRDDGRDYSFKTWPARLKNVWVYAFGQKKFFLDDQPAGIMHIVIFWGFITLSLQVVTMFARGWIHEFTIPGLSADLLGGPYALLRDLFELGVAVSVLIALARWVIIKPRRLFGILPAELKFSKKSHAEAIVILCFIFTIMTSGIFYDAGRMIAFADNADVLREAKWQPISSLMALWFIPNAEVGSLVAMLSWWIHNLVILVFMNILPRSKHFHIITSVFNVFFGRIEPYGRLAKKDFTVENPLFGRSQPKHFTWKQVLDMYSCTECGRCASVCPAAATNKPLAPRQLLLDLRDHMYGLQKEVVSFYGKPKAELESKEFDVIVGEGKAVIDDVIWSCVACRACEEACPVNIEYVDKIMDIRQYLTQEAARFPAELNRAFKGMETQSNPWGISASERSNWSEGMKVPTIQDNPNAEYIYYVGCGGSFDDNNKKATRSFVKLLQLAGINFATLGNSELCNGESARRLGNEYLFQSMADALTATLNETKIKNIIVNCPHCFNTLKNEYPEFGGNWKVFHAAEVVGKAVAEGRIKIDKEFDNKVVYHDSCYYGRYNDIYDEPRNLLAEIKGLSMDEMLSCKRHGTCCGAGGGRMWMEEKADERVNVMRTEQALERNPQVIATSCPYCRIMIGSGVNEKGVADKVKVMDVMEIVAESVQEKKSCCEEKGHEAPATHAT